MAEIQWGRFQRVEKNKDARSWLETQQMLGLADNTVMAYGRGVEDFLRWCADAKVDPLTAGRGDIAVYVGDLRNRKGPLGDKVLSIGSGAGLSNATMQQRLTAVRLFFDHLMEDGKRDTNPVGRGRYTPGKCFGKKDDRGLLQRFKQLPWIPSETQWKTFLNEAKSERIRNRCMIAIAYDAALRREELCSLQTTDLDPAHRLLRIRAETSKSRQDRVVPYSESAGVLLKAYLSHRRTLCHSRGPIFLSESRRNYAMPLTLWTWSKVIRRIADAAELPRFTTHTLRHLCLTDLARAGWDLHEIACFAGHRNLSVTQQYIHISGRELADKLTQASLHIERITPLKKGAQ